MGGFGGKSGFCLFARLAAVTVGALALANCSGGLSGKLDPRYGVAASERVVPPGEAVPKGGGVYRVGKPYVVAGREYVPHEDVNYSAVGLASWYGDDFHGRYTANGEIFDMNSISAAHPTMPLPSYARVTNLANHRSIIVRVNDRGPYARNRLIDVSVHTARLLGFYGEGVTKVKVDYIGRAPLAGSDDRKLAATLRTPGMPRVQIASAKTFAPYSYDRPITEYSGSIPELSDKPFKLGERAHYVPGVQPRRVDVASAEPQGLPASEQDEEAAAAPQVSPVSAYAPVGYDGSAGLLTGRGLY